MYDESTQVAEKTAVFEFISLYVGDQSFCIELNRIREIRRWEPVTMLPHSPPFVLGVVNLRGAVIPIIDLAAKLGFPPFEPTKRNVIIICNLGDQVIGLLVESVSEILTVNLSEMKEAPRVKEDASNSAIRGVISIKEDMTRVIDLEAMMGIAGEATLND